LPQMFDIGALASALDPVRVTLYGAQSLPR
jgi:hypothetical protein